MTWKTYLATRCQGNQTSFAGALDLTVGGRTVPGLSFAFYAHRMTNTNCERMVQVDGQSHVVHSEEEALGTRLTIDSLTCLLANEHDPSQLLASSPGKLVRYTVADGEHMANDQPYAEVEVSVLLLRMHDWADWHTPTPSWRFARLSREFWAPVAGKSTSCGYQHRPLR